jgi:capsular polysaccharide biosynthesis protein
MIYAEARFDLNDAPGATVHLYHPRHAVAVREQFQRFCERSMRPRAALTLVEIDDAIFIGRRDGNCRFDSTARRIDISCIHHHNEDVAEPWDAAETLPNLQVDITIREPIVFQSVFFPDWGHFLLESIARLWAICRLPELAEIPSLFAGANEPDSIGGTHREVLSLAGVRLLPPLDSSVRVRFTKCFVPSASLELGGFADPVHLLAPHKAADRLLATERRDGRPVYLSRSAVESHRPWVRPIRNELEFEARLESYGVRVVHMQRHKLAEQVEIMNAHTVFIAPWGSALHNILFSLRGRGISTFVLIGGFVPINFILVDSIVGNTAHYMMVMIRPPDFDEAKQHMIDIDATVAYLRRQGAL